MRSGFDLHARRLERLELLALGRLGERVAREIEPQERALRPALARFPRLDQRRQVADLVAFDDRQVQVLQLRQRAEILDLVVGEVERDESR